MVTSESFLHINATGKKTAKGEGGKRKINHQVKKKKKKKKRRKNGLGFVNVGSALTKTAKA